MSALFGILAFLVALVGLLIALGHAGYLAMLSSAANRRGASGRTVVDYVHDQRSMAGGLALIALVGLVCTITGGPVIDLIGLVLGGGAGVAGSRALGNTRSRFRGDI